MSKERKLTPIAAALGATFAVSLIASPITQAAANPFTMTDHGAGYMVAEGNCGDKKGEGSCGDKKGEGSCGDKKAEGSCGDKKAEGSCGDKKVSETYPVQGAGLGLRRAFIGSLADDIPSQIDFMEVAPENWIDVGGGLGRQFRKISEQIPMVCHGLSLNIGGPAPLDEPFIKRVKQFLEMYNMRIYSEHLSYCADDGHLYDLMPIPFTEEAVHYVADRIKRVQDIIGQRMAMENASYYAAPGKEMEEIDFVNAVLEEADCLFHIDINNIYVNSINHKYDAVKFLKALPGDRIAYAHIAGHYVEAEDLRVDTHGADVIDPVWKLLDVAYEHFGVFPTLLERDFNIPPMETLLKEVDTIRNYQLKHQENDDNIKQQQS